MPFGPTPRESSAKGCVPQRLSTEMAVVRLGNPNLPASHSAAAARSAMHNWRVRAHCRCVKPTLHPLPGPYCCFVSLATPIPEVSPCCHYCRTPCVNNAVRMIFHGPNCLAGYEYCPPSKASALHSPPEILSVHSGVQMYIQAMQDDKKTGDQHRVVKTCDGQSILQCP